MAFASGFMEEARRLGARLPSALKNPVSVAGMLTGGLAAYDLTRGLALHAHVTPEDVKGTTTGTTVDSVSYVRKLERAKPAAKPVLAVTTAESLDEMLRDRGFGVLDRMLMRGAVRHIHRKGDNAGALKGKDKYYIIVAPKASARVIEHEFGHLLDETSRSTLLTRLLGLFSKFAYKHTTMADERKAWEAVKKDTPLKEEALRTYESGFHRRRGDLAARMAAVLTLAGSLGGSSNAGGIR